MNNKNKTTIILIFLIVVALILSVYFGTAKQAIAPAPLVPTTPVATSTMPIVPPPTPVPPQTPPPIITTVTLDSLSPQNGPVGTTVTISGSGFTANNKILMDGNVGATNAHLSTLQNGNQALVFTVPSAIGPNCKSDQACPQYMRLVTPATYQVSVENENGTSNSLSFVVTGVALNAGIQ